jgi:oligopeptidase A
MSTPVNTCRDALFDKMLAAKNYQSGMQTLRQIEFALFDMLLHLEHDPQSDIQSLLLSGAQRSGGVAATTMGSHSAHTFSHIFAGGYAAGYYSYKWAEVLSSDAYAAFEETMGSGRLAECANRA